MYNMFIKLLNLIVRGKYKSFVTINQNTNRRHRRVEIDKKTIYSFVYASVV